MNNLDVVRELVDNLSSAIIETTVANKDMIDRGTFVPIIDVRLNYHKAISLTRSLEDYLKMMEKYEN